LREPADAQRSTVEPGVVELLVGASSADLGRRARLTVRA
jgi:hypothetical protein